MGAYQVWAERRNMLCTTATNNTLETFIVFVPQLRWVVPRFASVAIASSTSSCWAHLRLGLFSLSRAGSNRAANREAAARNSGLLKATRRPKSNPNSQNL